VLSTKIIRDYNSDIRDGKAI